MKVAESYLGSGMRLLPCWHFLSSGSSPTLRIRVLAVNCVAVRTELVLGAADAVSGDEVEGMSLRGELCSISGLAWPTVGKDGEVRASLLR